MPLPLGTLGRNGGFHSHIQPRAFVRSRNGGLGPHQGGSVQGRQGRPPSGAELFGTGAQWEEGAWWRHEQNLAKYLATLLSYSLVI